MAQSCFIAAVYLLTYIPPAVDPCSSKRLPVSGLKVSKFRGFLSSTTAAIVVSEVVLTASTRFIIFKTLSLYIYIYYNVRVYPPAHLQQPKAKYGSSLASYIYGLINQNDVIHNIIIALLSLVLPDANPW